MPYFYNAIILCFFLVASQSFASVTPRIEIKTKTRIAKGEAAIFQARVLGSGTKKMRLRYKNVLDEEYAWVDFERESEATFKATVPSDRIPGSYFYYYVVWQSESGLVESIYGTPGEPSRISIDRRPPNGVVHQNNVQYKSHQPLVSIKDRFGDDDAIQQMRVFAASDEYSFSSHLEQGSSIRTKMGSILIEQIGARDLADIVRGFPNFDFLFAPLRGRQPIFNGQLAQARIKLRIDDIELVDEFDGSSEWTLDAMSIAGVSIIDSSNLFVGESKGLLSEVKVDTSKSRGFTGRVRGGWPYDLNAATMVGLGVGGFENSASSALRHRSDVIQGSLLLKSEYWWDSNPRPFMTGKLQIFGVSPFVEGAQRVTWNGALAFDFPFSYRANSRISFLAGQTFFDQSLPEGKNYRLLRGGIEVHNDFLLHPFHLLSVSARAQFVAIANSVFHFENSLGSGEKIGFDIGPCDLLGVRTSAVNNCRLKSAVNTSYRYQIANWTALATGLEFVSATREVNDPQSMFHPNIFLELSPDVNLDFAVGYTSTLRWPTFLEKGAFLKNEADILPLRSNEVALSPEKLKQAVLQMRWHLISDYAYLTVDAQGRTGWLDDAIVLSPSMTNGRAYVNKGQIRFFALNVGVTAKLASANQVYIGSEFHSPSVAFPNMKLILGSRLNLGKIGSLHFEVQNLSFLAEKQLSLLRLKTFYQTRAIADHLVFELHAAQSFGNAKASEDDSFSGLFVGVKVLL